ncbi:MAG: DUF21 domain-containing protein [Deltaproteobacteria bacterium]|nr:DUF21 domain-containing protein [Deltaproteobacteria bacterium]
MEYDLIFKLILLAVLLVLSGFFSGSEASIFSLTSLHLHKMKEEKIPFSASVRTLLKRPRRRGQRIHKCRDRRPDDLRLYLYLWNRG